MRKLFALAAILVLTASMPGCESCSLFHGEKARPYPVCTPSCEPGCAPACAPACTPGYAPVTSCPSSAPTVGTISTTAPAVSAVETSPGPAI